MATKATSKPGGKAEGGRLIVEQYRSGICCPEKHKLTLRSLGLRRMRQRVDLPDNPSVRGKVATIPHLVRIVEEAARG